MTKLGKEPAMVLSRASTLQHNLECRHAPFRPLLGLRVGRLKVTGKPNLSCLGSFSFSSFDMSLLACFFVMCWKQHRLVDVPSKTRLRWR